MRGGHVTRHVKTDMERVIMVAAREGTNDAQVGPHCPLIDIVIVYPTGASHQP